MPTTHISVCTCRRTKQNSNGPTCESGDIPVLDLEHERVDEVREQVRAFVVMHLSATDPDRHRDSQRLLLCGCMDRMKVHTDLQAHLLDEDWKT